MKTNFLKSNQVNPRCITTWLFALLVSFAFIGYVVSIVVRKHDWFDQQMEYIEPRYARLRGLEPKTAELVDAVARLRIDILRYLIGPDVEPNQAGNDALQGVRKVLDISGFEIGSAQVVADSKGDGFDKIGIIVKGEANIVSLMSSLTGIQDLTPVVMVDSMTLQSTGVSIAHDPQRIVVQLNLSLLRGKK